MERREREGKEGEGIEREGETEMEGKRERKERNVHY